MRRCLSAVAFAALALGLTAPPLPALAQNDPASRALRYLSSRQMPDGSVPGFSPAQGTEDFAIAAGGAGYDPTSLKTSAGTSVYDYLSSGPNLTAETATAGGTGRLVEAVVAGGLSPAAFGGQNLVARLNSFNSGNGQFAAGAPFDQSLAILGLLAAGQTPPANAVTYLASLQKPDGGWEFGTGFGSDSNTTAMALMALDAAGHHANDASGLTALRRFQAGDGGFQYQAGFGSDPDSDALGVQALVATGQDPAGAAWATGGHTPYGWLLSNQDAASGGYGFQGSPPDAGTTTQVPSALELQAFPVRAVHGTTARATLAGSVAMGVSTLVYLNHQQAADGSLPGFSVAQGTEDFAIGAAAAGYDPTTLSGCGQTVYGYLAAHAASITDDAGSTGRLLEAVAAGRLDPHGFGGQDLVARLNSFNSGNGQFAAGAPFSQGLAMLGLLAAGQAVPANAVAYLASLQRPDGGWEFAPGYGSDSNTTALALLALDAGGQHANDAAALTALHSFQAADGGFQYQAGFGSDVDSDALVLQALLAAHQDPASTTWAQGSATVLTHLAASQDADGGFGYQSTTSDPGTTSQVPEGLERLPFPIRPAYTAGTRLPNPPACPSPTPSPTPAATPTPAPAATPTAAPVAPPVQETPAPGVPPSPSPAASPAASPSPPPSPAAAPTTEPGPTETPTRPVGSGGLPPLAIYLLAGLGGLALVAVAGGAYLLLARRA